MSFPLINFHKIQKKIYLIQFTCVIKRSKICLSIICLAIYKVVQFIIY